MKKNSITVKHARIIQKPPELVWDYTQNYNNRTKWDSTVLKATVLQETPNRIVNLKLNENTTIMMVYKLYDRPHKTSLVATEITSPIIQSASGSWSYEDVNGATLWQQTNTITFKEHLFLRFMLPFYKFLFVTAIKRAMSKAKNQIETLPF